MVLDPRGEIGTSIELRDCAAKNKSGRIIPLREDLRNAPDGSKKPNIDSNDLGIH
jgi:hypothetical protein